jgi:hypothetical protein
MLGGIGVTKRTLEIRGIAFQEPNSSVSKGTWQTMGLPRVAEPMLRRTAEPIFWRVAIHLIVMSKLLIAFPFALMSS